MLEENQRLKEENRWLNDVITTNISHLADEITLLKEKDVNIEVKVGTLNELHNELQIQHDQEILSLTEDVSNVKNEHIEDIVTVRSDIDDLKANMPLLTLAPIGSILAWIPRVNKHTTEVTDIPECYQLCDGSPINKGIWAGLSTPDLNNQQRFLSGGLPQDSLTFQEDSLQDHEHSLQVCNMYGSVALLSHNTLN